VPSALNLTFRTLIFRTSLYLIGITPIALMFCAVVSIWLPLPFWDEWTTPGENFVSWCNGRLGFQELFSQHNESRKFFPRLLYLALAAMGGWDVRKEMALLFLLVCAISVLFYRLMRSTPGATPASALIAWISATFLCFSPVQLRNFIWGIQLELFFPGLALLVVAAANLSRLSIAQKAVCNAAFALLATYTFAHGMLIWALGFPLPGTTERWKDRRVLQSWGAYLFCAILAVGSYFADYKRPPAHPELLAGDSGFLKVAVCLILWVGSYFGSSLFTPFFAGIVAIFIFLICLAGSFLALRAGRSWRAFYPGFLMATYACIIGGLTAAGRIGFGTQQALAFRYLPHSLFFYLAIVALLFALYCSHFRHALIRHRRLFLAGCLLVGSIACTGWIACQMDSLKTRKITAARNRTLLHALEWIDVIPDNPDLAFLFPSPDILRRTTDVLRAHKILRLRFAREDLAKHVSHPPPQLDGAPFGGLEKCVLDGESLAIAGRALAPEGKAPLSCIVLGALDSNGRFKLFAITPISNPGHGGDSIFSRHFNPANLPDGNLTIMAWAIDAAGEQAYPLGGAATLARSKP
jgi:hypothetical protein